MAPRFFRDEEGVFHQRIYGIDIENLDMMYGGIRPRDMLQSMGLACAMGMPLERVFADRRARALHHSRRARLDDATGASGSRSTPSTAWAAPCCFPTFMLAGGTFLPHLAPAVVPGLQRLDPATSTAPAPAAG